MQFLKNWIKPRWGSTPRWAKIIIFLLFPLVTAAVITGHSLFELWRDRKEATKRAARLLWLNLAVWAVAIIWAVGFWAVTLPWLLWLSYRLVQ